MPVRVQLTLRIVRSMHMLMMLIVHVPVFVLHLLVQMLVFVSLHRMEI